MTQTNVPLCRFFASFFLLDDFVRPYRPVPDDVDPGFLDEPFTFFELARNELLCTKNETQLAGTVPSFRNYNRWDLPLLPHSWRHRASLAVTSLL